MIRSLARLCAAALALLAIAGASAGAEDRLRLVMVTHGSAADPFWATIKEGADRAAEETGVELVYRAPDTFDLDAMAALIVAAVAEKPAGLIVSIPSGEKLEAPTRAAVDAGIPVISINSGFDVSKSFGALLHVGQDEYQAGRVAGEAMRERGGKRALCLNHEVGNVALDLRCLGFVDGFGGSVEVLPVEPDPKAVGEALTQKLAEDADIDTVLALSAATAGEPAVAAVKGLDSGRIVFVGSFDTSEAILAAVADRAASFAIDQQAFLQGYLPVQYLVLLHRYGLVPVSNVSTGPRLVTPEEAARRLGRSGGASGGGNASDSVAPAGVEPKGG